MVLTQAGELRVTDHAVLRYGERVKPGLTFMQAKRELAILLPQAEPLDHLPGWLRADEGLETDCFLCLCDSIALPVFDGYVLTCLVRGSVGPIARFARTKARQNRHKRHRAIKVAQRSGIVKRQSKGTSVRKHDWTEQ